MSGRPNLVVGLTGGIGSGKSSAAAYFGARGAYVVDADALSHQLTIPHGPAIDPINVAFPGVVNEGVLDRPKLREIVFSEESQRKRLEAILHPMVGEATRAAMSSAEARSAPYVILMVPLLFESRSYADRIDCAVLVDVDEVEQVQRVSTTRSVPAETVRQIIAAQMPRAERLLRTQFVIDNSGSRQSMERQVDTLHPVLVANAQRAFSRRQMIGAGAEQ